ncbi:MAG: glycosyltransferase family 9 protein [Candidatus Omnitrophica bacterium]|nr:glycosyltransferase family 9 protein [Candidatus Omnitrophota bacterium]
MKPFWRKNRPLSVRSKRVLIVQPFGIGDALFLTPLIRTLKEAGAQKVDLLLGSRTREIFETNPCVSEIFEWGKPSCRHLSERWACFKTVAFLFWRLRRNRYHIFIDVSPKAKYGAIAWFFFRIPVRIGFRLNGRGIFLTHRTELAGGYQEKAVSEYYLDLLRFFRPSSVSRQTELFLKEEDVTDALRILRKLGVNSDSVYFAVSPGGGESWGRDARLKRWPVSHFVQLIRGIRDQWKQTSHLKFLVLGGNNERSLGEALLKDLREETALNLCGATSIRVSAALIQKAAFLLANDGGLVHVAHALRKPLIAIYGPVDPVVYGPYPTSAQTVVVTRRGPVCRPCYQRFRYQADCQRVECLSGLMPEDVLEHLRSNRFFELFQTEMLST